MDSFDDVELYSLKSFDNAYAARKVLDHSLNDKATADKAAVQAAMATGQSRAEALEPVRGRCRVRAMVRLLLPAASSRSRGYGVARSA